jgi:hypothetical protein
MLSLARLVHELWIPPNRQSAQLKKAANGFLSIDEGKLRHNQLPDPVITASGFALHRPAHWR